MVMVGKEGRGSGEASLHRHGNRTHVFVKVSLSNICQPPNYRLLLLRLTPRTGLTAKVSVLAAQNEDAEHSEAAVRHKDSGRRSWISPDDFLLLVCCSFTEFVSRLLEFIFPFVMSHRALVLAKHFLGVGQTCHYFTYLDEAEHKADF